MKDKGHFYFLKKRLRFLPFLFILIISLYLYMEAMSQASLLAIRGGGSFVTATGSQNPITFLAADLQDEEDEAWEEEEEDEEDILDLEESNDRTEEGVVKEVTSEGSEPTSNSPPTVPVFIAPREGERLNTQQPTLVLREGNDADGDPITYCFEIYSDQQMTHLVAGAEITPANRVVSWQVPLMLTDNLRYYARVRATDKKSFTPWTYLTFFIDMVNDPPSTPTIRNPGDGAWVETATPTIELNPAIDPEGDAISYLFEVYEDPDLTILIAQGSSESTRWTIPSPLKDQTRYYLRAQARDDVGAASDWTLRTSFFVKVGQVNTPPRIDIKEVIPMSEGIRICWEDEDPDSNATIDISYKTDTIGGGQLIAGGIEEDRDGNGDCYIWEISGVQDGKYHVYATITDGQSTSTSYSATPIVLDRTPPTIEVISPNEGNILNSPFEVTIRVSDNLSGVSKAEYAVDGGVWSPLPLLDPATGTYGFTWQPVAEDKGVHSITFRAFDSSGNIAESPPINITIDLAALLPKAATAPRVSGTLTISPNPIYVGQEIVFVCSLANETKDEINGAKVRVLIIDPSSGEVKKTIERNATIPAASIASGNLNITSTDLPPQVYKAQMQLVYEGSELTVATADFEVKKAVNVTEGWGDPINLLVWLNKDCDMHTGEEGERITLDDLGVGRFKGKQRCVDLRLLESILSEATSSYLIVYDAATFAKEMRNPYFTDFLILGDHEQLPLLIAEELRERVYSGTGVISSLWLNGDKNESYDTLFGVRRKGALPGYFYSIATVPSQITEKGTIKVVGRGVRVEPQADAEVAGWIYGRNDWWYGGMKDKSGGRKPAIIIHECGFGRGIYFAFDLALSLNKWTYEAIANLLSKGIAYIHRRLDVESFLPLQLVPVEVQIKGVNTPLMAEVINSFPPELPIYDPTSGEWVTQGPWRLAITIPPNEMEMIRYYVLMPDLAGIYQIETSVILKGDSVRLPPYEERLQLTVAKDTAMMIADIISALQGLDVSRRERVRVKQAIRSLERISQSEEDVLSGLIRALDAISEVQSVDTKEIRLMLGLLLRSEEGRWYFYLRGED